MKASVLFLFLLVGLGGYSQNTPCETVTEFPDEAALPPKSESALFIYLKDRIVPLLGNCETPDGERITSLYLDLTIDTKGHVSAVDFLRSKLS